MGAAGRALVGLGNKAVRVARCADIVAHKVEVGGRSRARWCSSLQMKSALTD